MFAPTPILVGAGALNLKKMEKKINIKGHEYTMKYSVRARMIQEQITGKIFSLDTLTEQYVFFYAMLLAGTKEFGLPYDDFLDELDEHPDLFTEFGKFLAECMQRERALLSKADKGEGEEEKN